MQSSLETKRCTTTTYCHLTLGISVYMYYRAELLWDKALYNHYLLLLSCHLTLGISVYIYYLALLWFGVWAMSVSCSTTLGSWRCLHLSGRKKPDKQKAAVKKHTQKQNLFCHHVLLPCPLSTTTSCFLIFIYSLLKRINIYTHALSMLTYMKSCCCTVIVLCKMGTEPKRIVL